MFAIVEWQLQEKKLKKTIGRLNRKLASAWLYLGLARYLDVTLRRLFLLVSLSLQANSAINNLNNKFAAMNNLNRKFATMDHVSEIYISKHVSCTTSLYCVCAFI